MQQGAGTRRRIRRAGVTIVALLAGLLATTGAAAAATAPGGIVQLPGALGCLTNGGVEGCGSIHDSVSPLGLILSPDGRFAYAASYAGDQLLVFDRDPSTGALTQKAGRDGCVHGTAATADCASARFLAHPAGLAVAPDGRTLYAASEGTRAILVFDRDPATGTIAQKPGGAGCIADANPECAAARSLSAPFNIAISPDGRNLYSVSKVGNAVTALSIAGDGTLSQTTDGDGGVGCLANVATAVCTAGRALAGTYTVAVSPDGTTIYAGDFTDASVVAIRRDPATGRMVSIAGPQGCVDREGTSACTPLPALGGIRFVVLDAAGAHVYVTSDEGTVVVLDRHADGTIARHPGLTGCLSAGSVSGCTSVRGLTHGTGIALSPGGEHAYVGGDTGLTEYDVVDGGLAPRPGPTACVTARATAGCATGRALSDIYDVVVSPDGRFVYTSDTNTNGYQVFRRDSAGPACGAATLTVHAGSVGPLPLPCSDVDGDPFTTSIVDPPTLGSLGAIDDSAHTVVYAAPQGRNGTTTFTFRSSYPGGAFASGIGSITVHVVGAPPSPTPTPTPVPPSPTPVPPPPTQVPPAPLPAARGIDHDRDGFFAGQDCNDDNPAIRPGAREIRGNRIDENCDGVAEPFRTLTSPVATKWTVSGRRFRLTQLTLSQLPGHWRAQIRCKGRKCPFKKKALKGRRRKGVAHVLRSLKKRQRKFRAGQRIEVWVRAPGYNAKVARLRLKKGRIPTTRSLCVPRGSKRPRKRCS